MQNKEFILLSVVIRANATTHWVAVKLSLLLEGTVVAPPDKFGEALPVESANDGVFIDSDLFAIPAKS